MSEEDKPAFGKLMGTGTIACSIGIIVFGIMSLISDSLDNRIFMSIGSYTAVAGLLIGIGFMTYATIKYNKGIF